MPWFGIGVGPEDAKKYLEPESLNDGEDQATCLQLTGGSRFTQQQRSAIASALDQLLQQGLLTERDGRIHIPGDAS